MNPSTRAIVLAVVLVPVVSIIVFWAGLNVWGNWHDEWSGYNAASRISDGSCNIGILPIMGDIIPYSGDTSDDEATAPTVNPDDTLAMLRAMESDPNIRGVIARIDSYGGAPVASEIIANGLKSSTLPVVSVIREMGTSGGYWIATGAEHIIASPISDVGSIGITMSYLDNVAQNEKDGHHYVALTSAPLKDMGNPNRTLTAEERARFERDLQLVHDQFVKEVAGNRKLPIEDVQKLADGSAMTGTLALEHKLVDELGNQESARAWFAKKLDIPASDVIFCE